MIDARIDIDRWVVALRERIRNHSNLAAATTYVTDLVSRDLPPIFDFEHLSVLVGIERALLAQILELPEHYYHEFTIPKNSGGVRTILSPLPSLMVIQKWIKENVLDNVPVSPPAYEFV